MQRRALFYCFDNPLESLILTIIYNEFVLFMVVLLQSDHGWGPRSSNESSRGASRKLEFEQEDLFSSILGIEDPQCL